MLGQDVYEESFGVNRGWAKDNGTVLLGEAAVKASNIRAEEFYGYKDNSG